ncbi:MAG: HAD hydrolase-like protein, partial [Aliifodinibius sp.]|nr:HAD hydrolase-like protein [candidate division Zixibacteria bacterium]NIS45119.1 HAD hydrolase-like protein [candidate division Zixibacteria bacterium]NIT55934.1 HAD hydrolase-like protein [Fodinibius sp.]NIV05274.1 HAD hydrolase-like protein [candidate division Zixibacteria bacterium]NIY24518.1 HAD hydrolase-like protein [Fodinibius sp.]
IFEAALQRAGSEANQTIYIGDNYYADIVGAQKVGIVPILIDRIGAFHEFNCLSIRSLFDLKALLPALSPSN